jgi:lysozyme
MPDDQQTPPWEQKYAKPPAAGGNPWEQKYVKPPATTAAPAEDDTDKLLSTPVPIPPTQLPSPLRFGGAYAKQMRDIYMASGGTQAIPPPPPGYADWQKYYEAHKNEPSGAKLFFDAMRYMAAPGAAGAAAQRAWPEIEKQLPANVREYLGRLTGPWLEEFKQFGREFSAQQELKEGKRPEAAGKQAANITALIGLLLGLGRGPTFARAPGDLGRPVILPPEGRQLPPGPPGPRGARPTPPPGIQTVPPVQVDALGRPIRPPTTALAPTGQRVGPLGFMGRQLLGTTDFANQHFVEQTVKRNMRLESKEQGRFQTAVTQQQAGTQVARTQHEQEQNRLRQENQKAVDDAISAAQAENSRLQQEYDQDSEAFRQRQDALVKSTARAIIKQNQEFEAAYGPEQGRFSTMTNYTRGQAAERVIPRLGDQLTRILPQARNDARAQGNQLFNLMRARVANDANGNPIQFPADDFPAAIEQALGNLRGSPENIREFNNILDRFPEGEGPTPEEEEALPVPAGPLVPTADQIALSVFGTTAARAAERMGLEAWNEFVRNVQAQPGVPVTPPPIPGELFPPTAPVTVPVPAPRVADMIARVQQQPTGVTMTWNDLQGFLTELKYRMMAARNTNAPKDVFAALQSLHDFIDQKMLQIAGAQGQGAALTRARNFWADHMQFWFDKSAPMRQAIELGRQGVNRQNPAAPNANRIRIATLIGRAGLQPFIQRLAEFGPNGLRANSLALGIRRAQGIVKAGGSEPKALAPTRERFAKAMAKGREEPPTLRTVEPELPKPFREEPFKPPPPPVLKRPSDIPGWRRIGPEEIRQNNLQIATHRLQQLATWGQWVLPVSFWTTLSLGGQAIFGGSMEHFLLRTGALTVTIPAFIMARAAVVKLLSDPRVLQLLTSPSIEQIRSLDSIPDQYRADAARSVRRVAQVAQQRGIPVSPRLINWANQLGRARFPVIADPRERQDRKEQRRLDLLRQGRELTATPMQQQQQRSADLNAPALQPHIPASDQAFAEIAQREGYRDTAYLDTAATPRTEQEKRDGGVWTIGFGRTENVSPGETTTRDVEEQWARDRAADLQDQILGLLDVGVTDAQLASLISFSYQEGITRLKNSTLLKEVNAGHKEKAADEFRKWIYSGGQRRQSIIQSRERERIPFIAGAVQ